MLKKNSIKSLVTELVTTSPTKAPENVFVIRRTHRTVVYGTDNSTVVKFYAKEMNKSKALFRHEVMMLKRLEAQHIVFTPRVLSYGNLWYEMPHYNGGTLSFFSSEIALPIMIDVARLLIKFEKIGYLYLDLKPSNVMLSNWQPFIIDHEHAFFDDEKDEYYKKANMAPNETFGTPSCMAPEVVKNERDAISKRSVTYSWAAATYQAVTGGGLYAHMGGETVKDRAKEQLRGHIKGTPKNDGHFSDKFWDEIMLPCLSKNPDDRFDMVELYNRLRKFSVDSILAIE